MCLMHMEGFVGEYVVCGQYVADYSTIECRTFRPEGLRQLRTKLFCTQLTKKIICYVLPTNYIFAYIEQRSNEPLLLHGRFCKYVRR